MPRYKIIYLDQKSKIIVKMKIIFTFDRTSSVVAGIYENLYYKPRDLDPLDASEIS